MPVGAGRRRWSTEVLQVVTVVCDIAVIFGSAVVTARVYQGFLPKGPGDILLAMAALACCIFLAFMGARGAYRTAALSVARQQVVHVLAAWTFVFLNLAWIGFLLRASDAFARGTVVLWFVVGGFVLTALHGFGARALARAFASGAVSHSRVAVVAVAEEGGAARLVGRLADDGVEVASLTVVAPGEEGGPGLVGGRVGEDVRRTLAERPLDGVWVFASWNDRRQIEELRAELGPVPVPIHLFADHETERMLARPLLRVGDLVGLELQRAPLSKFDRAAKRVLDVTVASLCLLFLAPLMVLTSLAIVVESGRPILFRQHRKGFGARPFSILKFRSMTVREDGSDVVQATRGDQRITRIGRMIRRTSIDELPQLFNVLRGDMSLVGPRPHALAHDDYYDGLIASYALRQHVKPGITGWAQIKGLRGETREVEQMRARVEHDLWYIENWSIWLDLRILMVTALIVLFDDNAF